MEIMMVIVAISILATGWVVVQGYLEWQWLRSDEWKELRKQLVALGWKEDDPPSRKRMLEAQLRRRNELVDRGH